MKMRFTRVNYSYFGYLVTVIPILFLKVRWETRRESKSRNFEKQKKRRYPLGSAQKRKDIPSRITILPKKFGRWARGGGLENNNIFKNRTNRDLFVLKIIIENLGLGDNFPFWPGGGGSNFLIVLFMDINCKNIAFLLP